MKTSSCISMLIAAVFLFASGSAMAAGQEQQQAQQGQQQQAQQSSQQDSQQAQQFVDKQVTLQNGDKLGKVEQVIVDSQSGNVKYLILSRGGILGMGQSQLTIPREKVSQQGQQLTANLDFSELQQLAQQQQQGQQQGAQMLDQVLGQKVMGQQGSSIGTIDNLVIGTAGGAYAILSGQDNQQYPIPLSAIQKDQQGNFQTNLAQQDLQNAPSFKSDQQFPDLANQDWQQQIRSYYSQQQQGQQQQQAQQQLAQKEIRKVDKLIGMKIQDSQGKELGTVKDVIVTGEDQNYVLMSSADDNRIYPIPMNQLQQTQQGDLRASFDQQRLQDAPSFAQGELDKVNQQDFNQEVRAYYGTQQQKNQQQQQQSK